jgi:hypothetical protein
MTSFPRPAKAAFGLWAAIAAGCQSQVVDVPDPSSGPSHVVDSIIEMRPVGAPCGDPRQCASGGCSADLVRGSCGVCLRVRALGETCTGSLDTCRSSASCVGGVCKSRKKTVGEACTVGPKGESNDCDDEDWCERDDPQGGSASQGGTCRAKGVVGGACDDLVGCAGTAQCERHVCLAPSIGREGESCDERSCAPGLFCGDPMTCRPATLGLGADCASNIGAADCAPGTFCRLVGNTPSPDGGYPMTCQAAALEGESCSTTPCASGLFCASTAASNDFRCHALLGEGDACASLGDCRSGFECRAGSCKPAC